MNDGFDRRPDNSLPKTLHDFLTDISVPGPLGVAVSGGSDSTGLLLALNQVNRALASPRTLVALTVDHRLRAASAAEAAEVKDLCLRLGINHDTLAWDEPKPATGLQAAARAARYRLMADAAERLGLIGVVTGHTADDQSETIAMRRQRSSDDAAAGLAGIPPATLFDSRLWVLRPLLETRRDAIRLWLTGSGQGWVEDPSNADRRFERVRMRQHLLDAEAMTVGDIGGMRRARAAAVAELIESSATWQEDGCYRLDCDPAQFDTLIATLEAMAGLVGGRARAMDRGARAQLKDFVSCEAPSPRTLGRVVMKRTGNVIIMHRESRDLPLLDLAPGQTADWDGRFRISNQDAGRPLLVRAGSMTGKLPEMQRRDGDGIERFGLADASGGGFSIEPLCGRASRVQPVFELEVAQALAKLAGARPFPACPWAFAIN